MSLQNLSPKCPSCYAQSRPYWATANIYRCENCGLLFKHPFPTSESLTEMYSESWQEPHKSIAATGGTNDSLASSYADKLVRTLGRDRLDGLKLLDFGAGRGAMLDALSTLGAEVYAIEPFGHVYLANRGYKVYNDLNNIPENLRFDGIISLDVIEHLETPAEVLTKLMRHLQQHGWLHLATPNAGSLNTMITGPAWREVQNEGHLTFFTPSSLEWLLAKCGYKNIRRLKWFIEYDTNPIRRLIHLMLQMCSLDGELRYLAWNS